ncbi:hypothetical protein AAHC03_01223 [Spirometra sp. Aus1]
MKFLHFRLPEELFDSFPCLTWLDLRNNQLLEISRSICKLVNLTNLLVGANKLTKLPVEIGALKKLKGLNVEKNNLEFPSKDVLCRGTKYVISYLQRCFERKRKLKGDNETFDSDAVEKDSSVSKHVFQAEAQELDGGDRENTDTCQNPAKPDRTLCPSGDCDTFETMLDDLAIAWVDESLAQSESPIADRSARLLHKAKAYRRVKKQYFDRKRRWQSGFCRNSWSALPTQSQRHMYLLGDYPEPLTLDQLLTTQKEQKARLKRQAAMIRMDEIVQKAKDVECMGSWKKDYRKKQQNLSAIYSQKHPEAIKQEALDRIQYAPFDTNNKQLLIMLPTDLEKEKMKPKPGITGDPPPPHLDKDVLLMMEKERAKKDRMLYRQVNRLSDYINSKVMEPIQGSRAELEDASLNLALAMQLQMRLRRRRDVLTQLKMTTHPTAFL